MTWPEGDRLAEIFVPMEYSLRVIAGLAVGGVVLAQPWLWWPDLWGVPGLWILLAVAGGVLILTALFRAIRKGMAERYFRQYTREREQRRQWE
ncbi:hypothetical protein KOI35_22165 [Actinoplanes bogorensis]|uniref:Uncharacterized protein n=1 Tax=Paractinoplanes bogorensis TaxID=1610840 RepID=A0ABS5YVS4_9ACTN|nr:hypothetical protein [Actinoplanes bogorensis]MBU2666210.1 hypothetical protein [Actinoplanes bogorensis]